MKSVINRKILPFVLDYIVSLIFYIFICIFMFLTKFQLILMDIAFIISSIYFISNIVEMINLILKILKNDVVTEDICIFYIFDNRFEDLFNKRYTAIVCHKVKNNKFTNEKVNLKSSFSINLKEKSYANVTYYKKSKIVVEISPIKIMKH